MLYFSLAYAMLGITIASLMFKFTNVADQSWRGECGEKPAPLELKFIGLCIVWPVIAGFWIIAGVLTIPFMLLSTWCNYIQPEKFKS